VIPPIFTILKNAAAVTALIGTNPCRCFPAGNIPQVPIDQQTAQVPAVTWQTIGGAPYNVLADVPAADYQRVQLDCWSLDFDTTQTLADAVLAALAGAGYCVSFNGHDYDEETRRYRASFDFSFITSR
jgi:hypothetical protein